MTKSKCSNVPNFTILCDGMLMYQKMEVKDQKLPIILDGKFFQITSKNGDNVVAKCIHCVNTELSGSLFATSNFLRHLKVSTNTRNCESQ